MAEEIIAPAHLHTLKRLLKGGKRTDIFVCTDPHCTFERQAHYLNGKAAKCPYCGNEFIVNRFKLSKQGLIHCDGCSKAKNKKQPKKPALEEKLDKLMEKAL